MSSEGVVRAGPRAISTGKSRKVSPPAAHGFSSWRPGPEVAQEGCAVLAAENEEPAGSGGEAVKGAGERRVVRRQIGPVGGSGVIGPEVREVAWADNREERLGTQEDRLYRFALTSGAFDGGGGRWCVDIPDETDGDLCTFAPQPQRDKFTLTTSQLNETLVSKNNGHLLL